MSISENTAKINELITMINALPEAGGGGGLPDGIAAVSVGTYTPASESTTAAKVPHGLGEVPDFVAMYAEGAITSADFASYICAFASVPLSTGTGVGVRMLRYGSPNGSSFSISASVYYEGNYTTTTFSVVQSSSYKLKAGITYKFVVGKFA